MKNFARNHKRILSAIGIVVLLVALIEVWGLTGRSRGHLAARFDVWRGHYNLLAYGLPPSWRPEYARLLRERYGIKVRTVALCIVSRTLVSYADSYDEVSAAAANHKFGHDVFKECAEAAQRQETISIDIHAVSQGREAQELSPAALRKSVSTGNVQCDQGWNFSQSATVESPSGVRVSVELRGKTVLAKTKDDNRCLTDWIVHFAVSGSSQTIVAGTRDDDWYYEHVFEINGWSRDGKLLLMSMVTAAGDWDETIPVVYDMQSKRIWRTELAPLLDEFTPKDCLLYFRPLGFTASGRVLVDVGPLNAEDLAPGEKPCFQESLWALDYVRKQVTPVPADTIAERFGMLLEKK